MYRQITSSLLGNHEHFSIDEDQANQQFDQELFKSKFVSALKELRKTKKKFQDRSLRCNVVFSPQSKFIIGWQILNIILMYLYFIQIPIILAFENQSSFDNNERLFKYLNTPTIMVFICDIFINLNTSFYEDGLLKENPAQIRRHYFKTTFILDVISIFAILAYQILQFTNSFENQGLKLSLLVFYLRFVNLIRIQSTMNRSFDLNRKTKGFLKLFLLLMKILLICNAVACSAFFISNNMAMEGTSCATPCYWVMQTMYDGKPLFDYKDQFFVQYIFSLYWASTTMISIGYGDITPKNPTEVSFTIVVQFLSCLLYGYSINQIWSIIQELNSKKNKIHYRLNIINTYLRDKGVGYELTSKVNGYLNNYYHAKNLRERQIQAEIISELTPSLRREVFYQSYSNLFNHDYFLKTKVQLLSNACIEVKEVGYYENQTIFMENNRQPCLYYVKKGQLSNFVGSNTFIKNLKNDNLFGIYEFFTQLCFKSQLKTIVYSLLYCIAVSDWRKIIKSYNYEFQRYQITKKQLMICRNGYEINYRCEFCSSKNHRTEDCLDSRLRRQFLQHREQTTIEKNYRKKYLRKQSKPIQEDSHRKRHHKKSRKQSLRSELSHESLLFRSQNYDSLKKKSLMQDNQNNLRQGKMNLKNQKVKHEYEQILDKLKKKYKLTEYVEDLSNESSISSFEPNYQELIIDKVADFEFYYPRFNIKEQFRGESTRRRLTKRF